MIAAEEEYRKLRPIYENYCDRLANLINDLLTQAGVKVHAIEKRAKDVDSFKQKILKPEKKYKEPLRQITDLCGIRVIVHYSSDLDQVGKLLEQEFEIDKENSSDRGAVLKPNEFGYHSHHYVINLTDARKNLAEWRSFSGICAEVQVRTVLQHAWAAISHALQYKAKSNVPLELSRKLFRVSGLLELADEEFSEINAAAKLLSENIAKSLEDGNLNIGINIASIQQYLATSIKVAEITKSALKAGFTLDANYEDDDETDPISDITRACRIADINTVHELDELIKNKLSLIDKFFYQLMSEGTEWRGATEWFLALAVMLLRIECFEERTLVNNGWDKEIASFVLNAARKVLKEVQLKAAPAKRHR